MPPLGFFWLNGYNHHWLIFCFSAPPLREVLTFIYCPSNVSCPRQLPSWLLHCPTLLYSISLDQFTMLTNSLLSPYFYHQSLIRSPIPSTFNHIFSNQNGVVPFLSTLQSRKIRVCLDISLGSKLAIARKHLKKCSS